MEEMVEIVGESIKEIQHVLDIIGEDAHGVFRRADNMMFEEDVVIGPMVFSSDEMAAAADLSTPDGVANMQVATMIKKAFGG